MDGESIGKETISGRVAEWQGSLDRGLFDYLQETKYKNIQNIKLFQTFFKYK
jgi:hypothetical protein